MTSTNLSETESRLLMERLSTEIPVQSPTRSTTLKIAELLYVHGLNDSIEGQVVTLVQDVCGKKHLRTLLEEFSLKGDSVSILEELFSRWDMRYIKTGQWVNSEEKPNDFYLQDVFESMVLANGINGPNLEQLIEAYDRRWHPTDKYLLYTQSLIAECLWDQDLDELPSDVKEVLVRALLPFNGKVSSNGQINIVRKKLGMRIYQ